MSNTVVEIYQLIYPQVRSKNMAFVLTLCAGLFFLVGAIPTLLGHHKKGLIEFSIGMSFSVMLLLLAFDIVPEVMELMEGKRIFMYIFIVIGLVMVKLIDFLVPHHDHDAEVKTHERHLKHIGIISSIALIVHNIIEGIGIYNIALGSLKAGFVMAIGVGMHNIPFGIEIAATLSETKKDRKKIFLFLFVLALSTVLGALAMMIFGHIDNFTLGSLMSLTIGMIIYLVLFELLMELGASKNKKYSLAGLLFGTIFMIVILTIGG